MPQCVRSDALGDPGGACVQLDPPAGPTVEDLVQAWSNVSKYAPTAPVDVAADGYAGKQIEFTVPDHTEAECRDGHFALWYDGSAPRAGDVAPEFWAQGPQQHNKQLIIDVDGTRLAVTAFSLPDTSPENQAAVEQALASIEIG